MDSIDQVLISFYTTAHSARQKGRGQQAAIKLQLHIPKNLSCDWSTWFMKMLLLGLSLVRTSLQYRCTETGLQDKRTSVQLIQA